MFWDLEIFPLFLAKYLSGFFNNERVLSKQTFPRESQFSKSIFSATKVLIKGVKADFQKAYFPAMWLRFIVVASILVAAVSFSSEDYKVKGLETFGADDEMYSGYMPLKVLYICDICHSYLFTTNHLISSIACTLTLCCVVARRFDER